MNERDIENLIYKTLMSSSNRIVPRHTHNKVDSPAVLSENIQITSTGFTYPGTINFTPIYSPTVNTDNLFANTANINNLIVGSGSIIKKVISNVATLNFPAIPTNSSVDLTMTLTGAVVGDTVSLGVQNLVISAGVNCNNIIFFAWVSAPNIVTIRCMNNRTVGSANPAQGLFRSTIIQF